MICIIKKEKKNKNKKKLKKKAKRIHTMLYTEKVVLKEDFNYQTKTQNLYFSFFLMQLSPA